MRRHPVIEHKDTAHLTIGNRINCLAYRKMQLPDGFQDDEHQGCKQTSGLKGIRKHQRADAASAGIKPDEQHHSHNIYDERNTSRLEHELLQDDTHYIEPDGSTHHLRK